jgi:hypothetical protein
MNQSSVIGASLVVAYAVFIITKGELPCYLTVLGIATASGCPQPLQPAGCGGTGSSTTTTGGVGSTLGNIGSILGGVGSILRGIGGIGSSLPGGGIGFPGGGGIGFP